MTQKICKLLTAENAVLDGQEAGWVENLVSTRVIENWEAQDVPGHLKTIQDRLLRSGEQRSGRLLGLYQHVQRGMVANDSLEQMELRLTGLVVKRDGKLRVYNRIYEQVFNRDWLERSLAELRPYGGAMAAWLESGYQDESRLLRGQALQDARTWAKGKSLGDDDRRFLDASQEVENREMRILLAAEQEANQILKAATRKANRRNLFSLVGAVMALAIAAIAVPSAIVAGKARDAAKKETKAKQVTQIERLSTEALRQFETQPVQGLVSALEAGQQLQALVKQKAQTKGAKLVNQKLALEEYPAFSPIYSLHEILSTIQTREIPTRQGSVYSVSWSGDGQTLATGGEDGSVKLWSRTGAPLQTLKAQQGSVWSVSWSWDGQTLATGGLDGSVKLWSRTGEPLKTLKAQQGRVYSVSWSRDGQTLATGGLDGSVKLWPTEDLDAQLVKGCRWASSYLIGTPSALQTLTICQTPERLRAAAPNLVADSEDLARSGDIKAAIKGVETAQQWNPDLNVSDSWNSICWFGSLNGEAALVLFACDKAVARDPDDGSFRNSRGLARALTGDKRGAIDDFQAYIQWLDRTKQEDAAALKAQRQRWIDDLRAGKPRSAIFTKEVLEQLRRR